ncbi:MAG: MATE family efflux transporter [Pseudomonadales bacterium]
MPEADSSSATAQQQRTQNLLNAKPTGLLLRLASPNVLAFLVQALVSMTEIWYVGQLGTVPLAAMALMFPGLMLMQMLANGAIGGAVTSAVARAVGSGDLVRAEQLIWHALAIAGIAGLLFFILAQLWLEAGLEAISPDPLVVEQAKVYGLIVFSGAPLVWILGLLNSIYRGMGNMRFPALLMLASAVIQVPLSGVLVLGLFGVPSFGIAGAAISVLVVATLISSLAIRGLLDPTATLRLRLSRAQFSARLFRQILQVGLPSALSPVFTVTTISAVNVLVAEFGVAALAGYGIGSRIEFLLIPMVFGLGVAMNTAVGVNLGAGQVDRAVRIGWTGGALAAGLTGLIGLSLALVPELWAGLFSDDPATLDAACRYLRMSGPAFAFQGLGLSLYFASQGAGTVTWPVIATFIRLLAAVGIAAIGVYAFDAALDFVFFSTALGMVLYGCITAASLKLGVWNRAYAQASAALR